MKKQILTQKKKLEKVYKKHGFNSAEHLTDFQICAIGATAWQQRVICKRWIQHSNITLCYKNPSRPSITCSLGTSCLNVKGVTSGIVRRNIKNWIGKGTNKIARDCAVYNNLCEARNEAKSHVCQVCFDSSWSGPVGMLGMFNDATQKFSIHLPNGSTTEVDYTCVQLCSDNPFVQKLMAVRDAECGDDADRLINLVCLRGFDNGKSRRNGMRGFLGQYTEETGRFAFTTHPPFNEGVHKTWQVKWRNVVSVDELMAARFPGMGFS